MLALPLPIIIGEIFIFFMAVGEWGFLDTMGIYLLPSLLGLVILSLVKRVGLAQLQMGMMTGKPMEKSMMHSAAVFIGAILLVVPSFITRVFGIVLIVPGLRHLVLWRLNKVIQAKMKSGAQGGFQFGGPFGFGGNMGAGGTGFKYYQYTGRPNARPADDFYEEESPRERVIDAEVLDVTPLEITHGDKNKNEK